MNKHLVVTEALESIPIREGDPKALSPSEADELHRYIRLQELDERNIIVGRSDVRIVNYVGFIQLHTCSIEVLPKVRGNDAGRSRRVLLRMLEETGFLDIASSQWSDLHLERANLYEILGYLFATKLKHELYKGPYLAYQPVEENLMQVRGKILFSRQIFNEATKSSRLVCGYDRFDMNTPLNQVFKAALLVLMPRVVHAETQKLLRLCLIVLDEVDAVPARALTSWKVQLDRTNRRFAASYSLACLILKGSAMTTSRGFERHVSIVFKMNELFEAFIAALARRVFRTVSVQDKSYKLLIKENTDRGALQLIPDIVVTRPDGSQVIIDTKWKLLQEQAMRQGVQREDLYQMYAYLTRYKRADTTILLYPDFGQTHETGPHQVWRLEDQPGKKLKVFTIDYEHEQRAGEALSRMVWGEASNADITLLWE